VSSENTDERFMRVALGLAKRALGRAAPNPAVGCVIVDEAGHIAGRGWTQPGGRPHAETVALEKAGAFAQGATAYVSLEPCAHHGRTPPCTDALIKAKVKRVVTACEDPDPRTRGRGVEALRKAGIEVTTGVLPREAADLNAGFFLKVMEGRPLVSLKVAASLDGRIATMSGESKWITGEEARAYAHLLRARHDAVLIGIGTAMSDDPGLTVRLPGMEDRKPVRIVADSRLRIPLTAKLVKSARETPTWILTRADGGHERRRALADLGVTLVDVPAGEDGTMDMRVALKKLAERGMAVNVADTASFRRMLGSTFYQRWRGQLGRTAWNLLENEVGKLA